MWSLKVAAVQFSFLYVQTYNNTTSTTNNNNNNKSVQRVKIFDLACYI